MIEMFIAVFLVMLIMTLFLFRVLQKCSARLNASVKEQFLSHLQVYDRQIEEKSKTLQKLKEEAESIKRDMQETEIRETREVSLSAARIIENNADYIDPDFFKNYAYIQRNFKNRAYEAMKDKVEELMHGKKDLNVHEYKEIQELFTYDMQYEMMTISSEEQAEVFKTIAQNSVGKKRILKQYAQSHAIFDFKEFMEYIQDYIRQNDTMIYVYSRSGEKVLDDMPRNVTFLEDEGITEGYKVKYKDQVYDYSL